MFRLLKVAVCDYGARLATIDGGSLRNAIPREATAVITLPADNIETLWELIADYQDLYRSEYKGIEESLCLTAEMTEAPSSLIPEEIQDDLINAVEGCQNGVISMLNDFPGDGRIVIESGCREVGKRGDQCEDSCTKLIGEP